MMAHVDFELSQRQKWADPKCKELVLLVANRIAAIRYGDDHQVSPAEIAEDGTVHIFSSTNNHWLYPPTVNVGQNKGHWRLVGRYDTEQELELIINVLKLWL